MSVVRLIDTDRVHLEDEDPAHLLNRLGSDCGAHQASGLHGLSFDPLSFQQDCVASPEVGSGWCQMADGLVVTPVVVVINEVVDLGLKVAGQIVGLEQMPFFSAWCQRSILPWVWGWKGAPRMRRTPRSSSHSARSPA